MLLGTFKIMANKTIELKETQKELDCSKITNLEEVKLILSALRLFIKIDSNDYDKLKHLLK